MEPSLKLDKEIFREMVKFYGETLNIPPLARLRQKFIHILFSISRKRESALRNLLRYLQQAKVRFPRVLICF